MHGHTRATGRATFTCVTHATGVADDVLPNTQLLFSHRYSDCDGAQALREALHLVGEAFGTEGVVAIIGNGCSCVWQ